MKRQEHSTMLENICNDIHVSADHGKMQHSHSAGGAAKKISSITDSTLQLQHHVCIRKIIQHAFVDKNSYV